MKNKFTEICQNCGVLYDIRMQMFNGKGMKGDNSLFCPVCKYECEIPNIFLSDVEKQIKKNNIVNKIIDKMENKSYMFQYIYTTSWLGNKIEKDTDLITEEEANNLWNIYYPDCLERLKRNQRPQMIIWKDCKNDTDYHTKHKEIDYNDHLEIIGESIYKIEKNKI